MITAHSLLTEAELLRGIKFHHRTSRLRWCMPLCGLVLLSYFARELYRSPTDAWAYFYLMPFLGIMAILWPWLVPWFAKPRIRRMPTLGKSVTWAFDENQVAGEGDGFNFSQAWSTIYSATIGKEGLLIYPQKNWFYWIPRAGFASPGDFEWVGELIVNHVGRTKRVQ